ncbi:MAG: HAD-IA family hydrolase [Acidobacteriia bacterium]|nr:HAD-IA family hydrolase [Terriglobia bacterium]
MQLLIFDLDGTLVDSKLDLALSVNAMLEQMGLGPLDHEEIGGYVGHGVTALIQRALGDAATEESVERGLHIFLDYYRRHMLDNTVTYPGVREALEDLKTRRLAVLTNKPVRFSQEILSGLGVAHYFAFIYGGNSFPEKKPDPVGVVKLMGDLSAAPRQTLIIGDSDTDVLTGRNAGIWTCGVTYGFGAHTLNESPPDILLNDLRELPRLLDGSEAERGRT